MEGFSLRTDRATSPLLSPSPNSVLFFLTEATSDIILVVFFLDQESANYSLVLWIKFYLHSFVYVLTVTETLRFTKPQILTVWSLTESACWPPIETIFYSKKKHRKRLHAVGICSAVCFLHLTLNWELASLYVWTSLLLGFQIWLYHNLLDNFCDVI